MASVGLIVEGDYDEAALTEFVRGCLSTEATVICLRCGGAPQLMRKLPGFMEHFRYANAGSHVDKAIVVRDADRKIPEDLISQMESKISGRNYPFARNFLVIVQELEAWLLADEGALLSLTGKSVRRIPNPEKLVDPKARLTRILSDAGIAYTAEVARKIAAAARPEIVAARCPSFRKFQEAVVS